jgi:hypothetical protein
MLPTLYRVIHIHIEQNRTIFHILGSFTLAVYRYVMLGSVPRILI